MYRYEIQIKAGSKWTTHSVVEADKDGALKAWGYVSGTLSDAARLISHDYKGRVIVVKRQAPRAGYRVVYGETMPAWSRILPSLTEAERFAAKHRSFGDIVFSIEAV